MLERAFAQASAPGGFFDQTRQSGVLEHAFAQASAPGGFFEQTRKSGILDHQFARASERPKVKGVKKDGTQDKRCNARTLKRAAQQFSEDFAGSDVAKPGVMGKHFQKDAQGNN